MVLQRISEIWNGWNAADTRAASKGGERDREESPAGSATPLCSEKCGCAEELFVSNRAHAGANRAAGQRNGAGGSDVRRLDGGRLDAGGLGGGRLDGGRLGAVGAGDGESWPAASTVAAEPIAVRVSAHPDAGMSTVEYAVGTVVAAAFAAVLYKIVTGDSVVAGLTNLINSALSTSF